MAEKKYALEHLNDDEYDEAWDELHNRFEQFYTELCEDWVKRGLITEDEKKAALEKFKDEYFESEHLFETLLG